MVLYKILDFRFELVEYENISRDDVGFVAVASGKVLRGDDRDLLPIFGLDKQDFGMIICEMGRRNDLVDEAPQTKGFVRGLEIEHKVNRRSLTVLSDEV